MADERARELRRSMTPQEVKLWLHLRQLRAQGYHFRRQAPRGRYILDFVCLRHRLIVEVDGAQHGFETRAEQDARRDGFFDRRGFRTLRFWNHEIDRELDSVIDTIWHALQQPRSGEDEGAGLARISHAGEVHRGSE